jgi:hypothetical protein
MTCLHSMDDSTPGKREAFLDEVRAQLGRL